MSERLKQHTMSADHLSIWLQNRSLIHEMDIHLLQFHTQQLINFFGGIQKMLMLCLKDKSNLNLRAQQQFFALLHSFKSQRKESTNVDPMSQDDPNHTTQSSDLSQSPSPTTPISFIGIHDICISHIFQFLDQRSHFRLQIASRIFTIIGRKRDSFLVHPTNHTQYLHFGQHLSLIHNLSYILEQTTSDDIQHINHWKQGIQRLSAVGMHRMEDIAVIISAGIPLMLLDKLKVCIQCIDQKHTDLSLRILNVINDFLSHQQCRHEFISNGLLPLIINDIFDTDPNLIELSMESLQKLVIHQNAQHSCIRILINELQGFIPLVHNLTKCTFYIESALSVVEHILKSSYFDWTSPTNISGLQQLTTSIIFQCLNILQQSVDDEWMDMNNSVVHILSVIHKKMNQWTHFEITCFHHQNSENDRNINRNSYRNSSDNLELILFSLQRTKLRILGNITDQWMCIDPFLMCHDGIRSYLLNNLDQHQIMGIYTKLLCALRRPSRGNEPPLDMIKLSFDDIRDRFFGDGHFVILIITKFQSSLREYWKSTVHGQRLEFLVECCAFISALSEFDDDLIHYTFVPEFVNVIAESKAFVRFIEMELGRNPAKTTSVIASMIGVDNRMTGCFVGGNANAYKVMIRYCHTMDDNSLMKCCISLVPPQCDDNVERVMVQNGFVGALQSHLCRFWKSESEGDLIEIMCLLSRYVKKYKVSLIGGGMKQRLLGDAQRSITFRNRVNLYKIWA